MLINYIRQRNLSDEQNGYKGVPIGIVVALDKEHIGWSLCCPRDKWDKKLGLKIAENRAKLGKDIQNVFDNVCVRTFNRIERPLEFIQEKAQRYFKE